MSNHTSIHITFGRNVSDAPLHQTDWDNFVLDVQVELKVYLVANDLSKAPVEVHHGIGQYDGIYEASAKVSTYFEGDLPDTTNLQRGLGHLAFKYGQDSIAFAAGTSTLVPGIPAIDTVSL